MNEAMLEKIEAPAVQVEMIPLNRLFANEENPRKTMDATQLVELAESIEQIGVQVPLLVRQIPIFDQDGGEEHVGYQIVAGHRRLEAARTAGLDTLPCIVRDLTDEQTREIMLVENLQREDLPPMEEAEAYAQLQQTLGTTAAIAARVGKPIEYVTRRLKLVGLGLLQRDALRERLITIDHALLLAKLGAEEQEKACKWVLDKHAGSKTPLAKVLTSALATRDKGIVNNYLGYWQPESVPDLKQYIEQESGRKLATAPWDLSATNLHPDAKVGACNGCPSNTISNDALFNDLNIADATCADGACFAVKQATYVHIQMESVGKDALRLSWKISTAEPRMEIADVKPAPCGVINEVTMKVNDRQVLRQGQWIRAKAGSCKHVREGVTVDFDESGYGDSKGKPGEILRVCITPKCKAHPKDWEKKTANPQARRTGETWEQQQVKREAYLKAERPIRYAVYAKIREQVKDLNRSWMELAIAVADDSIQSDPMSIANAGGWKAANYGIAKKMLLENLKSAHGINLARLIFDLAHANAIEPRAHEYDRPAAQTRKELWELALSYGVNALAIAQTFEPKAETVKKPAAAKKTKAVKKAAAKSPAKKGQRSPALKLSKEVRKSIADAMKKRWAKAKVKKAGK